jgi:hypothetical protein
MHLSDFCEIIGNLKNDMSVFRGASIISVEVASIRPFAHDSLVLLDLGYCFV